MILTPIMAREVGEALINASNQVSNNKNTVRDVVIINKRAISMRPTDGDYGYEVVHVVKS